MERKINTPGMRGGAGHFFKVVLRIRVKAWNNKRGGGLGLGGGNSIKGGKHQEYLCHITGHCVSKR